MGDISDSIIDGDFDEYTGEYLGEGGGFPRHRGEFKKPIKTQVDSPKFIEVLREAQTLLINEGYVITELKKIDYGVLIRLHSGGIVNIYTSGKMNIQGKPDEKLNKIF